MAIFQVSVQMSISEIQRNKISQKLHNIKRVVVYIRTLVYVRIVWIGEREGRHLYLLTTVHHLNTNGSTYT